MMDRFLVISARCRDFRLCGLGKAWPFSSSLGRGKEDHDSCLGVLARSMLHHINIEQQ